MGNQFFMCREGHFYKAVEGFFSVKFVRVIPADGYEYPHPARLQAVPASMVLSEVKSRAPQVEDKRAAGSVEIPDEKFDWSNLVLYPETVATIRAAIHFIQNYDEVNRIFGVSKVDASRKQLLNFHGVPGTGKTLTAKAISRELQKPLLQVDYAAISSKWVGEGAKAISSMFQEARDKGAILFLDEADSLAAKRMGSPETSTDQYANQDKNVFMQELDKFAGIVIMTTNLFHNYDEALLRRIAEHVRFDLPNAEMRIRILKQNFGDSKAVQIDYGHAASITEGFSGGDLKNLYTNTVKVAANPAKRPAEWVITGTILTAVALQIRSTKLHHSGQSATGKRIGFGT